MRLLIPRGGAAAGRRQRGLTLIEVMVALVISVILLVTAAPSFTDYATNSRLRESGHMLYAQTLLARSEAIKRNTVVRLSTSGGTVQVIDRTDAANPVTLFTRTMSDGVSATTATIDFNGEGRTVNLAAGSINLSTTSASCSTTTRCPGLRVDGGGSIRLCGDHTGTCN
jgi:type IV fimbrial biogenesis protein FimT